MIVGREKVREARIIELFLGSAGRCVGRVQGFCLINK